MMHQPGVFQSFFSGGFECASHRRSDGRRLDLLRVTGHDRWAEQDYAALRRCGLLTVRDGLRWHLIEQRPGQYDWSSFLPMLRAAERQNMQVIWDLCHYGWPDHIDIWRPGFIERFARYAAAVARQVKDETAGVPFYSPLNEISFWAWAGGDVAYFNPMGRDRGFELKCQLVRASLAAMDAIRQVEPRARFVLVDPAINVVAMDGRPRSQREAEDVRLSQFQAWDMLGGTLWPGLGGSADYLDIIGVNYYSDNQWYLNGPKIRPGSPDYRPFRGMLSEIYYRYQRPLLVAETGAEGDLRGDWLRHVSEQVWLAMQQNIPVEGICLYPVLDYPGWTDDRHCPAGLFGFPDASGQRPVHEELADELCSQQTHLVLLQHQSNRR